MCTPGARSRRLKLPEPKAPETFTKESANAGSPWFAAKTTICRRYGPPVSVLVVSALAIFAATTSARMRSACIAEPEVSIIPKRFIDLSLPWLLLVVCVNRVHHALIFLAHKSYACFESQLRFGEVQAFAVHRHIIAIRSRDQAIYQAHAHA